MSEKPSIDDIRNSLAFRNVCEAMGRVFGNDWRVNTIWPDSPGNDFTASVDIYGISQAAYLSASGTHTHGMYASGPGGLIGISVPTPQTHFRYAPDGAWVTSLEEIAGTQEEQKRYSFGVDGKRLDDIAEYLRMLQRYLTSQVYKTHPSSEFSADRGPIDSHNPDIQDIQQSLPYRYACQAINQVFDSDWKINMIYPRDLGADFLMSVDIGHVLVAAYISVTGTYKVQGSPLGCGVVGVSVPTPGTQISQNFDQIQMSKVVDLVGTVEEKATFSRGVPGDDFNEIVEYFHILERYLEGYR